MQLHLSYKWKSYKSLKKESDNCCHIIIIANKVMVELRIQLINNSSSCNKSYRPILSALQPAVKSFRAEYLITQTRLAHK